MKIYMLHMDLTQKTYNHMITIEEYNELVITVNKLIEILQYHNIERSLAVDAAFLKKIKLK